VGRQIKFGETVVGCITYDSSGNTYTGEVKTKTKTTDLNHVHHRQAQRGNEIITTFKEAVRKTLDK
jgi:hypothetical protein